MGPGANGPLLAALLCLGSRLVVAKPRGGTQRTLATLQAEIRRLQGRWGVTSRHALRSHHASRLPTRPHRTLLLPVWVLSLRQRTDRRRRILHQLSSQSVPARVSFAIDGRDLTSKSDLIRFRQARHFRRELSAGMRGCVDSHRRLWRTFAADQGPSKNPKRTRVKPSRSRQQRYHLVLEDDAIVPDDFLANVRIAVDASPPDAQLLYLGSCHRSTGQNRTVRPRAYFQSLNGSEFSLVSPTRVLCSHAYALTAEGSRRLLEFTKRPFDTVDRMMNRAQRLGIVRAYAVVPSFVKQSGSPSDILNPMEPQKPLNAGV